MMLNERERQLNDDYEWGLRSPAVRRAYGGKIVAIHRGQVLGVGDDHLAALEAALLESACPSRDQLAFVAIPEEGGPPSPSATAVFLAWERLRLVYNLILACVVVAFAAVSAGGDQPLFWLHVFWLHAVTGALTANLCFCAGPVAEGYLCLAGFDRRVARWLLFLGGTLAAAGLAVESMRQWHVGGGFLL